MPQPPPPPTAEQLAGPRLIAEARGESAAVQGDSVVWVSRPQGMDFAAVYPEVAMVRAINGRVTLDCLVLDDGAVACAVAEETPQGFGFGEAARRLSARFRVAQQTAQGRPTAGGVTTLTIQFRIEDGSAPKPAPEQQPAAAEPQ